MNNESRVHYAEFQVRSPNMNKEKVKLHTVKRAVYTLAQQIETSAKFDYAPYSTRSELFGDEIFFTTSPRDAANA